MIDVRESPRVTIVVTPRERFGLTRRSLESIYDQTKAPFKLVYVDGNAPPDIAEYLEAVRGTYGFELMRSNHYLSPNQARNMGMAKVDTEFVCFVDNDLLVTPGWLTCLLQCADDTGAAAVGPLYFEGDPGERIIHMAGGVYEFSGRVGARSFTTDHLHQGVALDNCPVTLERRQVDFVEFHCMLVRVETLRDIGGLDERLLSTREHLDLCIQLNERNLGVWFEPSSEVTYLTPPPVDRADIPFYLRRWSEDWNRRSLQHFTSKHGIEPSYGSRLVAMRARRQVLLAPTRSVIERVLPGPVSKLVLRALARLERETNRLAFRAPDVG